MQAMVWACAIGVGKAGNGSRDFAATFLIFAPILLIYGVVCVFRFKHRVTGVLVLAAVLFNMWPVLDILA
jgi:hypothetical protein